jgi:hypothetical protein
MTSAERGNHTSRRATLASIMSVVLLVGCAAPAASPDASIVDAPPAASASLPAASASAAPSPEGVAADLASLLSVLERVHPEPFHGVDRDEFVAALDDYAAALPSLASEEAMVEFMRLWALLSREGRDGHQFALPQAQHAGPILPIRVYEFSEGLHVTAAMAPNEDLVGARVISVDETPIDEVLSLVEPLVPRDGPATVPAFRPIFLLRADVLRGLGIISGDSVAVEVEVEVEAAGTIRTVELTPVPADDYTEWAGPLGMHQLPIDPEVAYLASDAPFAAELRDGGVAYLRYRSVQGADVREARRWMESGEATRLILDLRQNPGGDNGTYGSLLRLVQEFAEMHPGSLSVLTDRVTFSAASNLATEIERTTDARFIGEPMAGGLNFWNDVTWVDLPNLPIPMRAAVSVRYWQFAADPADPRLTIEPDLAIEVTAAHHFARHDPVLEAALTP